jgi:hypothetical protein
MSDVTPNAWDRMTGSDRVHNWTRRGIPAAVKLEHQDLFLRHLKARAKAVAK